MAIKRAQIVGIREAENTSFGTTYNSTSYSVLVEHDNGKMELVEGSLSEISYLIPYMSIDTGETERLRAYIHDEINRVISALRPIPNVAGKLQSDAVRQLQDAGFSVRLLNSYPAGTPEGHVAAYSRQNEQPMTIILDVRHTMPDVVGKEFLIAEDVLRKAGFEVVIGQIIQNGQLEASTVIRASRQSETSMKALLTIAIPDVTGKSQKKAEELLQRAGFRTNAAVVISNEHPSGTVIKVAVHQDDVRMIDLQIAGQTCDVTGMQTEEAIRCLREDGITARVANRVFHQDVPVGHVCAWKGGPNHTVELTVSNGPIVVDYEPTGAQWNASDQTVYAATLSVDRMKRMMNITLFADASSMKNAMPSIKEEETPFALWYNDRSHDCVIRSCTESGVSKDAESLKAFAEISASLTEREVLEPARKVKLRLVRYEGSGLRRRQVPWIIELTFDKQ
ncbi:MAG: PASTA domain-containing protein [Clostridia bacterium]|nr:PASTA domain-containing protein [Clostridia bacterium]